MALIKHGEGNILPDEAPNRGGSTPGDAHAPQDEPVVRDEDRPAPQEDAHHRDGR
jgi:hypothetical protein